jgi:hypothetical protein
MNILTDFTFIQIVIILFAAFVVFCMVWTIITFIIKLLASSATDQNKRLLDNLKRLEDIEKNINQKLTK